MTTRNLVVWFSAILSMHRIIAVGDEPPEPEKFEWEKVEGDDLLELDLVDVKERIVGYPSTGEQVAPKVEESAPQTDGKFDQDDGKKEDVVDDISVLPDVGPATEIKFSRNGWKSYAVIANLAPEEIAKVKGVSLEGAKAIVKKAGELEAEKEG